jgi:Flp pilus assembly protein TadG
VARADRSPAQAFVEFALILPVMLIMTVGAFELGRAFVLGVAVQEGARASARLAATAFYDPSVDDAAVVGRLIAASHPALVGCSSVTISQSCNAARWTLSTSIVSTSGTAYPTIAAARAANALPGAQVTITARGRVALMPGLETGAMGITFPQISVQGQSAMVIL